MTTGAAFAALRKLFVVFVVLSIIVFGLVVVLSQRYKVYYTEKLKKSSLETKPTVFVAACLLGHLKENRPYVPVRLVAGRTWSGDCYAQLGVSNLSP